MPHRRLQGPEQTSSKRARRLERGRRKWIYAVTAVFCRSQMGVGQASTGAAMRSRTTLAARTPGGSTETTRQARSFEPSPTSHGFAAKPVERASRSKRTAGTIPRLDGNTACTTPDRELNDGSSRTSAPLDKSSRASNAGRRATPTPRRAARRTV